MSVYHSTRSRQSTCTAKEAIRKGIAPDGGLYVSDELGAVQIDCGSLAEQSYDQLARAVLGALLDDYSAAEIAACVDEAYGGTFASAEVTPIHLLDAPPAPDGSPALPGAVLELWHGPTSAFKDVALQMLPRLMARTAGAEGERIMIVTATSGDTGKAALAGFADAPGCGITVFYPQGKVSRVQNLQMSTQEGANVAVCGVRGNFDDAQSAVKRIFADEELAARLAREHKTVLSSANSINVGRLAPQVVYYFAAYAQLLRAGAIAPGDAVEYVVPTGNFGDILAGYYAQRMGLPVARLVVASDRNNVLFDFLETGVYDKNRPFYATTSPSMDILISSNLERMLYYAAGGDCGAVAGLMASLSATGRFEVDDATHAAIRAVFAGGWADEEQVAAAIRSCWEENGYVIDPHTACGYHVMEELPPAPGTTARVLLSTANPYKFPRAVAGALGLDIPEDDFACMKVLEEATGTTAPAQLSELEAKPVRFTDVEDIGALGAYVEAAAARL